MIEDAVRSVASVPPRLKNQETPLQNQCIFTHITPFPTLYSACRRFLTFLSQEAMEITLYYLISMALTQSEKEYSDF